MSEPTRDDRPDRYHETDFHDSPPLGLSRDREESETTVQICGEERSRRAIVEVERLRRRYEDETRVLMTSLGDSTRRAVVCAVLDESPRTYEDLSEYATTTTRTVKTHVSELVDEGVLRVEDGRPSTISFVSDDLRVVASDVFSFLE